MLDTFGRASANFERFRAPVLAKLGPDSADFGCIQPGVDDFCRIGPDVRRCLLDLAKFGRDSANSDFERRGPEVGPDSAGRRSILPSAVRRETSWIGALRGCLCWPYESWGKVALASPSVPGMARAPVPGLAAVPRSMAAAVSSGVLAKLWRIGPFLRRLLC